MFGEGLWRAGERCGQLKYVHAQSSSMPETVKNIWARWDENIWRSSRAAKSAHYELVKFGRLHGLDN